MFPISNGQGSAPTQQIAEFRSDGFTAATGLRVPFFSDQFARGLGLPDTRLVNMISEATPLREERPFVPLVGMREIRYGRPGLVTGLNYGTGPIRGLFVIPATLGGGFLIVSGARVYTQAGALLAGSIGGSGPVRFAASMQQMVVVSGGVAWLYDSTTGGQFVPISNGVLPPVSDVAWLAARFVYAAAGSNRFWYSEINDAANESGLDFATAESSPDPIVALSVLNDELVFFKTRSVEFWNSSSDANAPFAPIEGRGYQRGCMAQGSVVFLDNALFFIADDGIVYRSDNAPTRISSNTIEDKVRQCAQPASITAFTVTVSGHPFYVLNLPGVGSYAYDVSRVGTEMGAYGSSYARGEWGEWSSFGQETFRGACAVMTAPNTPWIGDGATNDVWTMDDGVYTDAGGPMTRMASAFVKIEEGSPRCTALALQCVEGVGNAIDPGSNPMVEMRYSDDLGHTYSRWMAASLGQQGRYGPPRAYWNRLGFMRAPGRLVEVRCSDAVNFTLSHLELNAVRSAW